MKNCQREWIEKNPILWRALNKVGEFLWFVVKVKLALIIIKLLSL